MPLALYADIPDPKDRSNAEALTRTGIIAGFAGLAALGGLVVTARTYRLSLQGHLTDRYTRAIEQLGDDKLDIRLGGIYALERVAIDSKRDHPTIVEVLSAFVRERTSLTFRNRPIGRKTAHPPSMAQRPSVPGADVQAALTVLGRLPNRRRVGTRIHVSRGDFTGASLRNVNLREAWLPEVALDDADLTGARFFSANLQGATLRGANLEGASFDRANLSGCSMEKANVTRTDFFMTYLAGTDLSTVVGLSQSQLDWAVSDQYTKIPERLTPAGWAFRSRERRTL